MQKTTDAYDRYADEWAQRLRTGNNPAHRWLEKPALQAALGDLSGQRILALGCGSGEETLLYRAAGAVHVTGLDISSALVEKARAFNPSDTFVQGDMQNLSAYPQQAFGTVVSSLAFHYLESWRDLLVEINRVLLPGGRLVFTTHHPIKWGALAVRGAEADSFTMAYTKYKNGDPPNIVGDYMGSRWVTDTWFGSMSVRYFHRPLAAMMADVLTSPLQLVQFDEPAPIPETNTQDANFAATHCRIPLFCLFVLQKPWA